MERGEVWSVLLDELRPVLLLSHNEGAWQAIVIVPPANVDISGVAIEVALAYADGSADLGVVRVALPRPDLVPCTWLVTITEGDVIARLGSSAAPTLREIDHALTLAGLAVS